MIAVLVATLLVTASPIDTVFTVDGGRVAGTVLEESPTSGVTIQMPDGTLRRIESSQIARIEFADGTVSNFRPQPAPAPVAPAPQAVPQGPVDTVHFSASGRVRGTVMEEDARSGVKIRLLDGSVHVYPMSDVSRIEYADGTVSTPRTPAAAAPAPAPAPAPKARPEAPIDTVFFLAGGRVRGTVLEEHPRTGVRVRLLDGSIVTYSREDLVRIEYADGSVSRRKAAEPAPPSHPAARPAPAATPVPPLDDKMEPAFPLYFTLGVGATFLGGKAENGVTMHSLFEPAQAHVSSEIGLRLGPSFSIGVYGDVGAGDPAKSIRDQCGVDLLDCTATSGRFGFQLRHTWSPLSSTAPWLSLGTGWEFAGVTSELRNGGGSQSDLFEYRGREFVRVGGGIDFRSSPLIGFGLYGAIAVGEFDRFKDPTTSGSISIDGRTHTTGEVGLRLILFP